MELKYNNTPETMSIEEAINLFQPFEDGSFYKSYVLMEDVIPKEYLDSKEFFEKIIPTRCAITYPSLLSYATDKLKADFELGIMSVKKNVSLNGLFRYVKREDYENMSDEDKQYSIVEENPDSKYVLLKSTLLEDPEFIENVYNTFVGTSDFSHIVYELSQYSKVFSSNNEYMKQAVSIRPETLSHYTGKDMNSIVLQTVNSMFESGNFHHYLTKDFISKQDKKVQDLLLMCDKIGELPKNAIIRHIIYKSICKNYMAKLEQSQENQEDVLEQL